MEKEYSLKSIQLRERETGRIIIRIEDEGEDLLRIYDYETFMTALRREMDRVIQGGK